MPIRAVIFDIGGVLKHTANPSIFRAWEKRLGLAEAELRALIYDGPPARESSLGRATPADVWRAVNERLHLPPDQLSKLQADAPKAFAWDMEMLAFIRLLRPRCKTAVLSSAWVDARSENQEQINSATFDVIVYSSEEGLLKPQPEIYRRTLERLAVAPPEAIFVDDMKRNVEAAEALGIHGIVYTNSRALREQITRMLEAGVSD